MDVLGGWDTAGFAPQSQNAMYFHSTSYEIISMMIMLLGTINFALHYFILSGNYKEGIRNAEIKSLFVTITSLSVLGIIALKAVYSTPIIAFRKVFYHFVSAHTGTGFATLYSQQFFYEWSDAAIILIVIAMLAGGSVCSTAGGIKALRIAILANALVNDIKK